MPEGNDAELLYAIARFSGGKGMPVPLQGLEDAVVILKSSNLGFAEYSFMLIGDAWHSSEMLDSICDLRERGYIRIKSSGGIEDKYDVLLNVSPSEAPDKLSGKVGLSACEGFLLSLKPHVLADELHGPVTGQLAYGALLRNCGFFKGAEQ